ncbi:MAG TPA: beta-galactosidase trimerization domain-containing protein, partial [Bacteroidota bacterium]|nr:beta-galactosidase trimerization domain-containing protein [Bacteroidota bacterium]
NAGQYGDLHAITQMDDPMMCDVLRSCARGRPVISAEMLVHFGYTLDLPEPASASTIKRYVFTGIAADLKGFIFWQYRPETLGREAPAWGLTLPDGSSTPTLEAFISVNSVLQKRAPFLLDAAPAKAQVAMLYIPENQVFGWAASGSEKTVTDSLLGMHGALYANNFIVDFIHPREITPDLLGAYRVVIVPFPYCLSEQICSALERWVAAGGLLIGESYFAGWDIERGRHQTTIPGYGLHRMFRARQGMVRPALADGSVDITVTEDLPLCPKGTHVSGAIVREELVSEGAQVLAAFDDKGPALTAAPHGQGEAVLIGSYLGLSYLRHGLEANADLIASLIERTVAIARPVASPRGRVRVDVLSAPNGGRMVIMQNLKDDPFTGSVAVPGLPACRMHEEFDGESLVWTAEGTGACAQVQLRAREVRVYYG